MLKPVSEEHSINRVIASVFLPQNVLNPILIFERIKGKEEYSTYQKKNLVHEKNISILNNKDLNITENRNIGFILEEFDQNGKSLNALKLENSDKNKSIISFETKSYKSWANYKERFLRDFENLSTEFDLNVEAIVLNYIDEFIWDSVEKIDVTSIFNKNSDLINQNFFNSYNASLKSVSQSSRIDEKDFEEENTEVFFNNDIKRIIVNHTYAIKLNSFAKFDKAKIETYFDKAHVSNKKVLKNLLKEEVQELIGLN